MPAPSLPNPQPVNSSRQLWSSKKYRHDAEHVHDRQHCPNEANGELRVLVVRREVRVLLDPKYSVASASCLEIQNCRYCSNSAVLCELKKQHAYKTWQLEESAPC